MCINCYIEYGSPKAINDEVVKAAELIKELYAHPEGITGSYGHIVFDDWNYESRHVDWCIEEAKKNEWRLEEDILELVMKALVQFNKLQSEDERVTALALADGYLKPEDINATEI